MRLAVELLSDAHQGVIVGPDDIDAIGHRVVHGGEEFHQPTRISKDVLTAIEKNIPLAPLHNPANLDGIRVAQELFAGVAQVAVFDTAFHQTIPPHAYHYAIPYDLYEKQRVRRYGFHGTSHKFVAGECARFMGKPLDKLNLISIHLGNGCSMTAVKMAECRHHTWTYSVGRVGDGHPQWRCRSGNSCLSGQKSAIWILTPSMRCLIRSPD